jgi:hypothetical protein
MLALSLTELVAIIPATQPIDAPMVAVLGAVYGVVTVVIGAGLLTGFEPVIPRCERCGQIAVTRGNMSYCGSVGRLWSERRETE